MLPPQVLTMAARRLSESAMGKQSRETATMLHLEMWTFVHGIATMMATSFLLLDWELISDMLTDVYLGIRERHVKKEQEVQIDACN